MLDAWLASPIVTVTHIYVNRFLYNLKKAFLTDSENSMHSDKGNFVQW